jgi:hypothetical protein
MAGSHIDAPHARPGSPVPSPASPCTRTQGDLYCQLAAARGAAAGALQPAGDGPSFDFDGLLHAAELNLEGFPDDLGELQCGGLHCPPAAAEDLQQLTGGPISDPGQLGRGESRSGDLSSGPDSSCQSGLIHAGHGQVSWAWRADGRGGGGWGVGASGSLDPPYGRTPACARTAA